MGLKLNGTHQLLVNAVDMNLLGTKMYTIDKNTKTIIHACKKLSLEVNAKKTKYILLSCHQNAGQNHDMHLKPVRIMFDCKLLG
jgi:hypothetical protein